MEGSFVESRNINKTKHSSFPPVYTIGAELDGMTRITRIAESFYYDYFSHPTNSPRAPLIKQDQTVIVTGMCHFQFVSSGEPTKIIRENDIAPEIELSEAQNRTTSLITAFMRSTLNQATDSDTRLINDYMQSTQALVLPILSGFDLEGFYDLKPPCYNQTRDDCNQGSRWTQVSQNQMSSIDPRYLNITDTFRPAAQIPEHFPSIKAKNCPGENCLLKISTYTENVYDNVMVSIAAREMRTKMISHQAVLEAFTGKKFDFNQTDSGNICAEINKKSLAWAFLNAPEKTLKRYLAKGKMIVPGNDIDFKTGFTWLNTNLVGYF